jgi:hypothetical protein
MSTEIVVNAVLALAYAEQTACALASAHEKASAYVFAPLADKAAIGSIWEIIGIAGVNRVILATGVLQAVDLGASKDLLEGIEATGLTVSLTVRSPNGPTAANVKAVLAGYDPTEGIAIAAAAGAATFNVATEQDVATLAIGYTRINVFVTPTIANCNALGSIWRLYATAGAVRTLLREQVVTSVSASLDIFGDVIAGSDGYVLTAQQPLALAGAAPTTASLIGSSGAGTPAVASIVLAGDTVGPSNANTLQQVSGGDGGHAGRVGMNAGAYFSWSPFASQSTVGDLRWGDIETVPRTLLSSRDPGNTVDKPIVGVQAGPALFFGANGAGAAGWLTRVLGASVSLFPAGGPSATFATASATYFDWNLENWTTVPGGVFTRAFDATCTEYDVSINSIVLTGLTPVKWNPKKGQRDAVTVITDANYTILQTDHTVALADTPTAARTFTLPAISSSAAGDEYPISVGALAGFPLSVAPAGTDKINGVNAAASLGADFSAATFKLISAAIGWRIL